MVLSEVRAPHCGSILPWLTIYERLLSLELAILEEHAPILPSERQPFVGIWALEEDKLERQFKELK